MTLSDRSITKNLCSSAVHKISNYINNLHMCKILKLNSFNDRLFLPKIATSLTKQSTGVFDALFHI